MIQITKHTSSICGCVTWYQWDNDDPEVSRVHTDIALAPCQIHDPVNFGKTLIVDTLNDATLHIVGQSTANPVEIIEDVRPAQVKDVIPLSISITPRQEMYLQEETRSVLLKVEEISEEDFDENGKPIGRKFKEDIEVNFAFNEDRKLLVELDGAEVSEKQVAETALNDSSLDTDKIIVS